MQKRIISIIVTFWVIVGGSAINAENRTWADIRSGCVVLQQLDFSCGLASLATILQFEFGLQVDERELLRDVLALAKVHQEANDNSVIDKARSSCGSRVSFSQGEARKELLENGASLLQLWCLTRMRGVEAYVREATPDFLARNLDRPIVVHLTIDSELQHFAVLRKIEGKWVHLADPSRGCKVYLLSAFLKEWQKRQVLILHKSDGYVPLQGQLLPRKTAEPIERMRKHLSRKGSPTQIGR